jgi:hypothetical protein
MGLLGRLKDPLVGQSQWIVWEGLMNCKNNDLDVSNIQVRRQKEQQIEINLSRYQKYLPGGDSVPSWLRNICECVM